MHHEITLDLVLTGFQSDPSEITTLLGVEPSQSWLQGDLVARTMLKRHSNGWLLSSGRDRTSELESHLFALFEKVAPIKERFRVLPPSTQVGVSCAVYVYHSASEDEEHNTPALHLNADQIRMLSTLGADFDIDLYVLQE